MLFRAVFRYRIPMALLTGLLCLSPFQYSLIGLGDTAQHASLAITLLAIALSIFNKTTDIPEDSLNPRSLPLNAAKKRAATIVAAVFLILPMPWVATHSLYFLGAYLGIAAMGYLFSPGVGRLRLKKIFVVKNIAVALTFALATVTPYYFFAPDVQAHYFLMYFIGNALLMLCIDVLNDIRDIKGDKTAHIPTIANSMGVIPAQILSVACIGGYAAYWATFYMPEIPLMIAYIAMAVVVVVAPRMKGYKIYHAIPAIWIGMTAVTLLKKIFA